MTFRSILFRDPGDRPSGGQTGAPNFFVDLNLDQIVAAIIAGKEEYDLAPFFHAPLRNLEAIEFRHDIMRDLEQPELFNHIGAFARNMRAVRDHFAQAGKLRHRLQQQAWFLDAADIYCDAVMKLLKDMCSISLNSYGLRAFLDHLADYAGAAAFRSLFQQVKQLKADLAAIRYGTLIQGTRVDVRLYEGEPDYSAEVLATFERFRQGEAQGYKFDFSEPAEVNHIEAQILDRVALLYPELFGELGRFCADMADFRDQTLVAFDREIQFYVAYLAYIGPLRERGLSFCYPQATAERGEIYDYEAFDLALAGRLAERHQTPVCNEFHLRGPERIIVVSGPNQGGKTTFARMFGQLHYLAALGCPIPGRSARLTLADRLFTHFERRENMGDLRGKLQDDLVRIHGILDAATPRSVIVMNEIFSSTALQDAIVLGKKVAAEIMQLDLYCVWVTFIDELASLGQKTVSMTSTVVPDSPAERTYKILRRPADGLAYAMSIAEKYRLTRDMIIERIPS
ncbi:MAG TPA: DNA mismatch repair protein MutS [Stellaceae bacterium]|nr:DNA mismatch repair protein MutS [Stellaceae bacterium]